MKKDDRRETAKSVRKTIGRLVCKPGSVIKDRSKYTRKTKHKGRREAPYLPYTSNLKWCTSD